MSFMSNIVNSSINLTHSTQEALFSNITNRTQTAASYIISNVTGADTLAVFASHTLSDATLSAVPSVMADAALETAPLTSGTSLGGRILGFFSKGLSCDGLSGLKRKFCTSAVSFINKAVTENGNFFKIMLSFGALIAIYVLRNKENSRLEETRQKIEKERKELEEIRADIQRILQSQSTNASVQGSLSRSLIEEPLAQNIATQSTPNAAATTTSSSSSNTPKAPEIYPILSQPNTPTSNTETPRKQVSFDLTQNEEISAKIEPNPDDDSHSTPINQNPSQNIIADNTITPIHHTLQVEMTPVTRRYFEAIKDLPIVSGQTSERNVASHEPSSDLVTEPDAHNEVPGALPEIAEEPSESNAPLPSSSEASTKN